VTAAPRIVRLPEAVAAKIAAGEVIERPAAVAKELLENALDAGAGRVEVALEAGGRRLVQVADDGEGMTPEEARLALERHATSKIRSADDLLRIGTYGFRGEALASIATVSRLTLVTRARGAPAAWRLSVEAGRVVDEGPAGAPPGTTVAVRDLFFNLPARRQFLRSPAAETAQVTDVVARLAIARPAVAVALVVDGRAAVTGRRDADRAERLGLLFGPGAPPFVEIAAAAGGAAVSGYLSPPGVSRAGAGGLYLFVNGRAVRDRGLLHAVLQGSRHAHEAGRYPIGALFLDLPPERVDVNVHPQKAEVRFRDPSAVHGLVAGAVEAALVRAGALPAAGIGAGMWPAERAWPGRPRSETGSPAPTSEREPRGEAPRAAPAGRSGETAADLAPEDPRVAEAVAAWEVRPAPPAPAPGPRFASLRYIGQLRASYLLCEGEAGLVIVDQHAAHERLRFERMRRARLDGRPPAARLLVPRTVAMRPDRASVVTERAALLSALGLEVARFGPGGTLLVTAVPAGLEALDPAPLLEAVADDVDGVGPGVPVDEAADHLLATIACHGAVTFGQALDPTEARALLDDLDRFAVTGACPHGRPVSRVVGFGDLERLFQR
jgi:DNA mismatch repair protein MutL